MRFIVEPSFWTLFPAAQIGVVIVRGVDNTRNTDACAALLRDAMAEAARSIGDADMATHSAVAPWREAYRAFGVKPAKQRSSIENLLRAAVAGTLRSINPLVDLYNTVSLRHLLPCGGEDLRAIRGAIRLTRAVGGEAFVPLGGVEPQPPQPGEVIYRDDLGVICRAWNWREAERTKLTAQTTDAFLCIEALPPTERLHAACADLASLVTAYLGGASSVHLLSMQEPEKVLPVLDQTMEGPCMEQPIVNIVGEKIALGPRRRDLIPLHQQWANDFVATRNIGAFGPVTVERETAYYERIATSNDYLSFTIYERASWRPIGSTELMHVEYRNGRADFGIFIGEAEARGKGYGTEATRLMLDYAFIGLGLRNVALTVAEWNIAGQRAYAKAGFREYGRRRQCWKMGGQWWDEIAMDCLATDFESPMLARVFLPDAPR